MRRAIKLPSRAGARVYSEELLSKGLFFLAIYFLTNWLASQRSNHLHLFLDWEKEIPQIPIFILAYISVYFIFLLPLFTMSPTEIRKMGDQFLWITLMAGLIFMLFPATIGFDRNIPAGIFSNLFESLYSADLPHNLAPSLHISYSTLMIASAEKAVGDVHFKNTLRIWLLLVMLSVLFVHQHHLFDIISGFGLTKWVMSSHFEEFREKLRRRILSRA